MAMFSSNYQIDPETGHLNISKGDWDAFWSFGDRTPSDDELRYMLEYNTAIDQYNQQYALQKDAFAANKSNMIFNQNLATDQFNLQKESYYNGLVNQARQMSSLGINPASVGGITSGPSVSGGSASPGVGSLGSPSGMSRISQVYNKKMMQMQMLAFLSDQKLKQGQLDVARANAAANVMNAGSNRISAHASAGLSGANQAQVEEVTNFLKTNGYLPPSGYSNTQEGFNWSKVIGVGSALALGLQLYGNNKNNNNRPSGRSGKGEPNVISSSVSDADNTERQMSLLPAIQANLETAFSDVPNVDTLAKGVGLDINSKETPTYGSLLKDKLSGVNYQELAAGIMLAISVGTAVAAAVF